MDINFNLQEVDRSRNDRLKAKACISFQHCGELACEVDVSYTAIQDARLRPREEKMARDALNYTLCVHQSMGIAAAEAIAA